MVLWSTGKIAVPKDAGTGDKQKEDAAAVEKARESRRRRREEQNASQNAASEAQPAEVWSSQAQAEKAQAQSQGNQPRIHTIRLAQPQNQAQATTFTGLTLQSPVIGQPPASLEQHAEPTPPPQPQSQVYAPPSQRQAQPAYAPQHQLQAQPPLPQPQAQQATVAPQPQPQAQEASAGESRKVPMFLQRNTNVKQTASTGPPWRRKREQQPKPEPESNQSIPAVAGQMPSMLSVGSSQPQISQAPYTPSGEPWEKSTHSSTNQTSFQTMNSTEPQVTVIRGAAQRFMQPGVQPAQPISQIVKPAQPTVPAVQPAVKSVQPAMQPAGYYNQPQQVPMQPAGYYNQPQTMNYNQPQQVTPAQLESNYYTPQQAAPQQPTGQYIQPQARSDQPAASTYTPPVQPAVQYNQPYNQPQARPAQPTLSYNQPQMMEQSMAPAIHLAQGMASQQPMGQSVHKPVTPGTPPAQPWQQMNIPAQAPVQPIQPEVPLQPESVPAPAPVPVNTVTKKKKKSKKTKGGPSEDQLWQDFDESAYLSGRISIFGNEDAKPYEKKAPKKKELAPWENRKKKEQEFDDFDEQAFLGETELMQRAQERLREEEEQYVPVETREDFDEAAFLAGQAKVVGMEGSGVAYTPKQKVKEVAPWEKHRREGKDDNFDEDAFLGKTYEAERRGEEEEEVNQENFDEKAFLSGQVRILGGQGSTIPRVPKEKKKELAPWEIRRKPEGAEENFDEDAFLGREHEEQYRREEEDPEYRKNFDEKAFLAGQVSILGGEGSGIPRAPKDKEEEKAPWVRDRPEGQDEQYDEDAFLGRERKATEEEDDNVDERNNMPFSETAFLMGKIPLVRGGAVDVDEIEELERQQREAEEEQRLAEEREAARLGCKGDFDEQAFLSGKVGLYGQKREEGYERPQKEEAERTPWQHRQERAEAEEFDEASFLRARADADKVGQISQDDAGDEKIVSKFRQRAQDHEEGRSDDIVFPSDLLGRKSRSREASAVSAGSGHEDSDWAVSDEAHLIHSGKDIPSRAFSSLDRVTARQHLLAMENEGQRRENPDDPTVKLAMLRSKLAPVAVGGQEEESSEESEEEEQVTTF